ncbi:uncharacterized protein [Cardiocondyla obscurior]|uniref:uncharacterized protein n=1 Tax=Cardiocondyla obscurior TaxID=286306 RepID=UPI003965727B
MERPVGGTNSSVLERVLEQQSQLFERLSTRSSTMSVREAQVKFPPINLPTFNGQSEDWKRYQDTFRTLIHDSELTKIQKFQYLVESLKDQAAKTIESIEISEDNYDIAMQLLRRRYDDERDIKQKHIQCLFELPSVKRESAGAIKELVDHVQKHLRVLKGMGLPTGSLSAVKARNDRRRKRVRDEERRAREKERSKANRTKKPTKTVLTTTSQEGKCYLCQGNHMLYGCRQFLSLSVEDRISEIRRLRLCLNCFRRDHFVKNCRASSCKDCGERHNTLCHKTRTAGQVLIGGKEAHADSPSSRTVLCSTSGTESGEARGERSTIPETRAQVLMSTAIVTAQGNGANQSIRVLLDSASEANFITATACKKLNLKLEDAYEAVIRINNVACATHNGCRLTIKSQISEFEIGVYCLVVPKITKKLPPISVRSTGLAVPKNLPLADPSFHEPGNIDALIGGEFFFRLLETGRIELGNNLPVMQNSKLGWIVSGPVLLRDVKQTTKPRAVHHTCFATRREHIDETVRKFWELEEYAENKTILSQEEELCKRYFVDTTVRESSGRFTVRLPFRDNKAQLGRSRKIALRRLNYLEKKFYREPNLRELYTNFMREYISLNHMTKLTKDLNLTSAVYLPHHGVMRESSTTTKLRVVFDASARTSSGISLNDTLMVGATLQDNIINILLRFRLPTIAITANLQKMYRQVLLHPDDQNYQRILWRFDARHPVEEYALNTVTYGQSSAPYLAVRSIRQLAEDEASEFPQAARVLLSDLYVDDIITDTETEEQAVQLIDQLKKLLRRGGFETHKWRTNRGPSGKARSSERVSKASALEIDAGTTKVLGMSWVPDSDTFKFANEPTRNLVTTKREILSAISKLFDPLGLVGLILTRAKLLMQQTWLSEREWDEPLTDALREA